MEGASGVDGRWMGLLEPGGVFRCPGVRGGSLAGSARRRPRWKGSLRPVLLPAGFGYSLAPAARPVRGCPWNRPRGSPQPRTYSGRRRYAETGPVMFAQVNGHVAWRGGAVCKTVGSAYVGSNPTPATRFSRSKPVTLDCVTGSSVQRERLRRPLAFGCGPWVGQIQPSADVGHERSICLLTCENDQPGRHLGDTVGAAEAGRPWAMPGRSDCSRTYGGQGHAGTGGACNRLLSRTVTYAGGQSPSRGRLRSAG